MSVMAATNSSIFGAMLQEFDEAAHILNLEPGIWKILTSPKRQIIVSCPVQMDNGEIEVFTRYRRTPTSCRRGGRGGPPLSPRRAPRRNPPRRGGGGGGGGRPLTFRAGAERGVWCATRQRCQSGKANLPPAATSPRSSMRSAP